MKNIITGIRIAAGCALILLSAYLLCFFIGVVGLIVGALLMIGGVVAAYVLEKHSKGWFFAMGAVLAFAVVGLRFLPHMPWHYAQYFAAGFVVYFACQLVIIESKIRPLESNPANVVK
ncbi:MAG: hypothetical protein FWC93_07880 [Defluviitaleaceae bacterium]|nr:hypothetical protein [Defluviitaleaceae bacterium]